MRDNLNNSQTDNNTTLRDYARVLFRQKATIIIFFFSVMTTVYIGLQLKTPLYEAKVKMLVSGKQKGAAIYYKDLGSSNQKVTSNRGELVKSVPVIKLAVDALKLYNRPNDYEREFASPLKQKWMDWKSTRSSKKKTIGLSAREQEDLTYRRALETFRQKIKVEPIRDSNMFTIKVADFDPQMAATMANVVSRAYVIFDLQQQLAELKLKYRDNHPTVRQIFDHINLMKNTLNGELLEGIEAIGPATVKIIGQALPPLKSSGSSKTLSMIMAVFMSLFLGVMMAFMFDYMDQTIKTPKELTALLEVPLLGAISKKKFSRKALIKKSPKPLKGSAYHNSYRELTNQIQLLTNRKQIKTILITAPDIHEGATTVITNLGFCLSNYANMKVLVIDANFYHPSIQKIYKLKDTAGLSDILSAKAEFDEAIQEIKPNFSVITSGQARLDSMSSPDSEKIKDILDKAKAKFDIVLIDCADLKHCADAVVMSEHVDSIILLVAEGKTRRQAIEKVVAPLKERDSKLAGVILNNRTFVIPGFVYERV